MNTWHWPPPGPGDADPLMGSLAVALVRERVAKAVTHGDFVALRLHCIIVRSGAGDIKAEAALEGDGEFLGALFDV